MKIRRSILLFTVVMVAFMGLLLWYGKRQPRETQAVTRTESNVTPAAIMRNAPGVSLVATNAQTSKTPQSAQPAMFPPGSKAERAIGLLSTYNDQPIVFYGKILDQKGDPVADALVNFGVRINNGAESTVKRGQVTSDANGAFTISGYKGESLGLGVEKRGYTWVSMDGSGIYSKLWPEDERAHPDPNNPTIIKMWKLQGAEPLVKINGQYKLHYTGEPISFDLLTGKTVPTGGDIVLTVTRSPGSISRHNRPDWSVQVAAVNGGVMDSGGQEAVTYSAPDSGYQPSMTFIFSTNAPYKWFGEFNQGFFVMSRNGQVYSKLGLSFRINEEPNGFMYITFVGVANTNSSRNWEATIPE